MKALGPESFVAGKKEVIVQSGGKDVTLFVQQIGFLDMQKLRLDVRGEDMNYMAKLLVAAVVDGDGNRFTYDEARNLIPAVARPLLEAAIEINGLGDNTEKN